MKKNLSLAALALIALVGLSNSGVFDAFIAFLLVGAIPGTTYSLPPIVMLALSLIALWALTVRCAAVPLLTFIKIDRLARQHLARKERMPKRRFSEISAR